MLKEDIKELLLINKRTKLKVVGHIDSRICENVLNEDVRSGNYRYLVNTNDDYLIIQSVVDYSNIADYYEFFNDKDKVLHKSKMNIYTSRSKA